MNLGRPGRTVALVVAAMVLAGCAGGSRPPETAVGSTGTDDGRLLPPTPTALPEYDAATFDRLMQELRGTPVLVYAWASWCGPCYREAPEIAAVSEAYRGRVQVLGLDVMDHPVPAREFIEEFGWTFPSVGDPDKEILRHLGFVGPPVLVLYDEAGREAFVWSGPLSAQALSQNIDDALAT